MAKSADAFRTISEVAEWLEVPAHVLRFWESKFSQIKPVKRAGGRRYYRPADMILLGGIKALLHDEGMTIKGVQKLLREQGVRHVSDLSQALDEVTEGEVSNIALDVPPEPLAPAKVLNFARAETPPTTPVADDAEDKPETNPATAQEPENAALPEAEDLPETDAPKLPPLSPGLSRPAPIDTLAPASMAPTAPPLGEQDEDGLSAHLADDATPSDATEDLLTSEPAPEPVAEPIDSEPEQSAAPEDAPAPLSQPDLPDDAPDDLAADPGILSALSNRPRPISPETAARLTPLLARLSALGAAKSQDGQLRD
ncbi:MAG: MerR family transcriptional regulator [Roseovarius sp.]|nr:MerR family transcriptional regulator [Roseovarius sp.]